MNTHRKGVEKESRAKMSNRDLVNLLRDLVTINSVNPAYSGGRPEQFVQEYVKQFFTNHAIDTTVQEVSPGRPNIIAHLQGRNRSRRIVFEAHCDTAGTDGMRTPFSPLIKADNMYGRGACDTKASLAAMMWAAADLARSGHVPKCDVYIASVVDEEYGSQGVLKLRESLEANAAVVGEPTQMKMVVASKGCLRAPIRVIGRAAHSSRPELGINAIKEMANLVLEIEIESKNLTDRKHWLVGSPTLNIGLIEGGTQVNNVPDRCEIVFDRRLIPGEDPDVVMSEYQELLDRFGTANPHLRVELDAPLLKDWPLETPLDADIIRCVKEILTDSGLDSSPCGVPFGSDASKLAQVNIPTIILGPGNIEKAHTAEEYVELDQVELAFKIYRRIMLDFE